MKTRLFVHHPKAGQVSLRGAGDSLGDWNRDVPPSWTNTDVACFELDRPQETSTPLKPVISAEGLWALGRNDVVPAGSSEFHLYPTFEKGPGQVKTLFSNFYSHILQNHRDITVYLPPGYDENPQKRYPVLYMLDGQNVFEATGSEHGASWRADQTMDALVHADKASPAIVIGVAHKGEHRIAEYSPTPDARFPQAGKANLFCDFLEQELKPQVDAALRTEAGAENTSLVGSSMGGLLSLYCGMTRPHFVKNVASMSPSSWWNNQWLTREIGEGRLTPGGLKRLWVDHGDRVADEGDITQHLKAALRSHGLQEGDGRFQTWEQPGAPHSEAEWAKRLPMVFEWLLRR